jgi:acetyl esterase/lipase
MPSIPLTSDQFTELLWPSGAPGTQGDEELDKPAIAPFLPDNPAASRGAVVVFPGGGYGTLAMGHEGADVAAWLNARGLAAFVVRYRLGPRYRHPSMLQDAQRAMRIVRSRAAEWKIVPGQIGVWGFSAGGHLASTLSTHWEESVDTTGEPIEAVSCRPDFSILAYPVISFHNWVHGGSKRNLLGEEPSLELVHNLSNETQVNESTPPTFLFHTSGDASVPARNSIDYFSALQAAGVPSELHIYERGRHGVGLAPADPVLSTWPARLDDWLRLRGVL